MLACGVVGSLVDENLQMSETTYLDSMYNFYKAVFALFGTIYLKELTVKDIAPLLSINDARGFSGMI
jgi:hypothetical protein